MKREFYNDTISTNDKINDLLSTGDSRSTFKTDVTFTDYLGNNIISIKRHRHNMTVLGGRLSVLEKMFGIAPNKTQRLFISDMIPDPTDANAASNGYSTFSKMDDDATYSAKHTANTIFNNDSKKFESYVKYFCIGNGGEQANTPYAIYDVHDWETRLYNMVPFRTVPVSSDLTTEEQKLYALKKRITIGDSSYYAYYAKKFEIAGGVVNSKKSDADYVPQTNDSNPYTGDSAHTMSGSTSTIFVTFELNINELEFKEFYSLTHSNSLTGARLTEIGLISALENDGEIYDPTLFAKLVHEPVFLSSEGSKRRVTYSVFA